jgi:hypothetical protein
MDDGARAISLEAGICDPVVLWDASLASSGMRPLSSVFACPFMVQKGLLGVTEKVGKLGP